MTAEEQLQLKEKIETRIVRTHSEIAELKEVTKPIEVSSTIGRLTRMDAINNKSVNEATLRESKEKMKGLEYSLAQFGTDKFGKCVNCGNEIPFGRLLFLPESVKCVKCAR